MRRLLNSRVALLAVAVLIGLAAGMLMPRSAEATPNDHECREKGCQNVMYGPVEGCGLLPCQGVQSADFWMCYPETGRECITNTTLYGSYPCMGTCGSVGCFFPVGKCGWTLGQ